MPSNLSFEYDLFLDESGNFMETSTMPVERTEALQQKRLFPSQLAGLLVPRGALTEGAAKEVRNRALAAIGLPPQQVHATELLPSVKKERYNRFVAELANEQQRKGWQPVRLVNREQVRYGDRAATYTNLVAELVLRICQQKLKEGQPRLSLRLFCARVTLRKTPDGHLLDLDKQDYHRRITEYLGFAAVRRGSAQESTAWRLNDLIIRSGKDDPGLQLCDVISHASHDDFHPCEPATADVLRGLLGAYDFSLTFRELIERLDQLIGEGSFALALLELAGNLVRGELADDVRHEARLRLNDIIDRVANLAAPGRNFHLAIVASWLEQIIELQRSLELGYLLARWLQAEVELPLRQQLEGKPDSRSLDWFAFSLHTCALSASNHRGALRDARHEVRELERLTPLIAGQWEHASLLMKGMVANSVHLTDCFDYTEASARMQVVAGYYRELGELFQVALPKLFPERVRSDLHGRALGTWLQSELYAGLKDRPRLETARRLSDQAIDEFPSDSDKERQYQYRCQIETACGNWEEARRFLARSLRLEDHSHAALGSGISDLAGRDPSAQGFALLHWLRLGAAACLAGDPTESGCFLQALGQSGALKWPWSKGEATEDYPTHGILRRVAVLHAVTGDPHAAIGVLRRLGDILANDKTDRITLQAIQLAAHAEVAALLWESESRLARRLLDSSDTTRPGLLQLLRELQRRTQTDFSGVWRLFEPWPTVIEHALAEKGKEEQVRPSLIGLAQAIGY